MEHLGGKKLIIAIDGPSGAGKSTVGRALARRLGYLYINTGAMYRAVALKARERAIGPEDEMALSRLVSSIHIAFMAKGEETHIFCDGEDVTHAIGSPEISRLSSDISKSKGVREALVQMQREMGRKGGVVLDGRDIGTVVFPDADIKFYLEADPEERGRRRFRELSEKGVEVDFKETLKGVIERDQNDMNRPLSPLRRADDAILIDSTCRSVEEVVEEMCRIAAEKRRW
ncbi:MAG: (d)CMP kinase, partial [Thermodesulfobacteriota bacterium]|nr:(d)CMP kinase [Thermodesulfobacteriota bacterium]